MKCSKGPIRGNDFPITASPITVHVNWNAFLLTSSILEQTSLTQKEKRLQFNI